MMSEPSSPAINMLLDQLCNAENNDRQMESFKQLNYIQLALGEQRSLNELIPFLTQLIEAQDDQVVIGISQAGLTLVRDYYYTFYKKREYFSTLVQYLWKLSLALINNIYMTLVQIQDTLINQQVINDVKQIFYFVFHSYRLIKAPTQDMVKKNTSYHSSIHEFVIKLLFNNQKQYVQSQLQIETAVMISSFYLANSRFDIGSNTEQFFKILNQITDHLLKIQQESQQNNKPNAVCQQLAKTLLDSLVESTNNEDNLQMNKNEAIKYIDQIIQLANKLLNKVDNNYSVKINFIPLYMNVLRFCQLNFGELNIKSILESIITWTNILTKQQNIQQNQLDNLNENKLQQYQIIKVFAEIFEVSVACNFKQLKELILQKISQEIEQNMRQNQQQYHQQQQQLINNNSQNNNNNYNQNVIECDEQGIQSLLATQIKGIAEVLAKSKLNDHQEIVDFLIKQLKILMESDNQNVKKEVAESLMQITLCYSTKKEIIDNILPLFLQLLRDQNPEVKIKLLKKINPLSQKLGLEMLQQSILPAITDLSQEINWRIKEKLIKMFIFYAKEIKTGAELINSAPVKKVILDFFMDKVYSVRNSMAVNLFQLAKLMGSNWTEAIIKSLIEQQKENNSYQLRITLLRTLSNISSFTCISRSFFLQKVMSVFEQYKKDPVVNVRHNLAIQLKSDAAHDFISLDNEKVKNILICLSQDINSDVKSSAINALK